MQNKINQLQLILPVKNGCLQLFDSMYLIGDTLSSKSSTLDRRQFANNYTAYLSDNDKS